MGILWLSHLGICEIWIPILVRVQKRCWSWVSIILVNAVAPITMWPAFTAAPSQLYGELWRSFSFHSGSKTPSVGTWLKYPWRFWLLDESWIQCKRAVPVVHFSQWARRSISEEVGWTMPSAISTAPQRNQYRHFFTALSGFLALLFSWMVER